MAKHGATRTNSDVAIPLNVQRNSCEHRPHERSFIREAQGWQRLFGHRPQTTTTAHNSTSPRCSYSEWTACDIRPAISVTSTKYSRPAAQSDADNCMMADHQYTLHVHHYKHMRCIAMRFDGSHTTATQPWHRARTHREQHMDADDGIMRADCCLFRKRGPMCVRISQCGVGGFHVCPRAAPPRAHAIPHNVATHRAESARPIPWRASHATHDSPRGSLQFGDTH